MRGSLSVARYKRPASFSRPDFADDTRPLTHISSGLMHTRAQPMLSMAEMPLTPSFRSSWAKLARAHDHRETLATLITQHFSVPANVPTLIAELGIAEGCHVFRVASVPPTITELQETVSVIIGDAVHNLRSALDHLVFQLAKLSTNAQIKNERAVQFPIAENPKTYEKQERLYLSDLRQEYKNLIETYQPYHGIARPSEPPYIHELALLQELSNTDKHRLLNTVLTIAGGASFRFPPGIALAEIGPEPIPYPFRNRGETLDIGVEVGREMLIGINIPSSFCDAGYIIPNITLEQKRPVIGTLEQLEQFVALILRDFETRVARP